MTKSLLIEQDELTAAWRQAFLAVYDVGELRPLVVTMRGFSDFPRVDPDITALLDAELRRMGQWESVTTASTLFPASLWNPLESRKLLYTRYERLLPRITRVPANRRGTYFERLIAYGDGKINQLETLFSTWERGITRRSAYVASLFDPARDHVATPLLGFPCLHQVGFAREDGTLAVTGWYTNQYLFTRGLGNYLGLARLGAFMAHEMSLPLGRVTCIASIASTGASTKKELAHLVRALR